MPNRPSAYDNDTCSVGTETLCFLLFCSHSQVCRPNFLILFYVMLGFWKSPAEPAQAFSFSGLQRTQELYHSSPSSMFSSSLNVGFNPKYEGPTPNTNHLYWTMRETRTESYSASINKAPTEKKQESTTSGCRLFGIEIGSSAVTPVVTVASVGHDPPPPALSVDAESDQLSQPSHANKATDAPAASSDRSPNETESRQARSCTKVTIGYEHFSSRPLWRREWN